jgi:hypothetical protein
MNSPVATDVAYAAGLFEGEGCVSIHRHHPRRQNHPTFSLEALVNMCDREPTDLLHRFWGGRLYTITPKEANWRPITRWLVSGRYAAIFLAAIRPHLQTQRVEAKVELALAFQAQKMPKGPALSFAYHARQAEFAAAIRQLNRVGAAALSADERQEVVDTLLRSSQQPELIA